MNIAKEIMRIKKKEHWSNYWRQGHLTSLPCGFEANYDGEFLRFWDEQFALLGSGACVLDVCSGNGSIALLAQDYSRRKSLGFTIKAVDAADIDVSSAVKKNAALAQHLAAIEFVPNTLLERITEEPESADLVTSQFGIEYTDWNRSAKNVHRILKRGGYFSMVAHTLDSTIITQIELQLRDYNRLLNVEIFSRAFALEGSENSPGKFVSQLDHALDKIYEMFKRSRSDVLSGVGSALDNIRKLTVKQFDEGFQAFAQLRAGVRVSHSIANDLLRVGRALGKSPEWYRVFMEYGLELIESGALHYHTGEVAGKFYRFRKSA